MSECIDHGQKGDHKGYGRTSLGRGTCKLYHRVVYCRTHGVTYESISGKVVRHTCDNPRCINPEHLLLGTYADNSNDMVTRGRSKRGATHWNNKLTPVQVAEIRLRFKARCPHNGATALASEFGVSPQHVSALVKGVSWEWANE